MKELLKMLAAENKTFHIDVNNGPGWSIVKDPNGYDYEAQLIKVYDDSLLLKTYYRTIAIPLSVITEISY